MSGDKPAAGRNLPKGTRLAGSGSSENTRLRIRFSKTEDMRYTGHLDLHLTWERTIRRAGLPLAYSQGYNRHPRLQLALALPLGITSECELLDAWFETSFDLIEARTALKRAAPPGLLILDAAERALQEPALQTQVRSAIYVVTLLDQVAKLDARTADLLAAQTLPRVRRGKTYDLRLLIEALRQVSPDGEGRSRLEMQLAGREGQTGRPDEVLRALDISPESARAHRVQMILDEWAGKPPLIGGGV